MFDFTFDDYFDSPHKVLVLNFTPAICTTPWVCKTIFPSKFRINRNRKRAASKMPSEDRFLRDIVPSKQLSLYDTFGYQCPVRDCHNQCRIEEKLFSVPLKPVQVSKKNAFIYNSFVTLIILNIHINTSYYNANITVTQQHAFLLVNNMSYILLFYCK